MSNKSKQIISLNTIPNTIFFVILVVGIGAVLGLWSYEIFETDKKLVSINEIQTIDSENISNEKIYFGNNSIQIKSPQKNAKIKNPVLISGKANVFEANVRVKIRDNKGNIIADDFITATGWMDKLYPFERKINYKTPQTENGIIEIFEDSAKDGSEIHKVVIPVVFNN